MEIGYITSIYLLPEYMERFTRSQIYSFSTLASHCLDNFCYKVYTMYIPNVRRVLYASTSKRMGK